MFGWTSDWKGSWQASKQASKRESVLESKQWEKLLEHLCRSLTTELRYSIRLQTTVGVAVTICTRVYYASLYIALRELLNATLLLRVPWYCSHHWYATWALIIPLHNWSRYSLIRFSSFRESMASALDKVYKFSEPFDCLVLKMIRKGYNFFSGWE